MSSSQEGKNENERFADELLALEKKENEGHGMPFVRDIAIYWRQGDLESARQIAWTDNDKLRNYPDIQEWLEKNLFGPDIDSPVKLMERTKRRFPPVDIGRS